MKYKCVIEYHNAMGEQTQEPQVVILSQPCQRVEEPAGVNDEVIILVILMTLAVFMVGMCYAAKIVRDFIRSVYH